MRYMTQPSKNYNSPCGHWWPRPVGAHHAAQPPPTRSAPNYLLRYSRAPSLSAADALIQLRQALCYNPGGPGFPPV